MDLALMAIRKSNDHPCGFVVGDTVYPMQAPGITDLGRRLYEMNLAAVTQRYPDDTKNTAPGPCDISDIHDSYIFTEASPDQLAATPLDWIIDLGDDPLLLALRCLRYQCSEGDVPDTWPEYQQIDRICETWG